MIRGHVSSVIVSFFFQAEDGIRDSPVTGVQTCALPISDEHNTLCLSVFDPGLRKNLGLVNFSRLEVPDHPHSDYRGPVRNFAPPEATGRVNPRVLITSAMKPYPGKMISHPDLLSGENGFTRLEPARSVIRDHSGS